MKKIAFLSFGLIFLFNSCTRIYVNEISRVSGFNINSEKSKNFLVVGSNELLLNDFEKTYNKKYSNNRAFIGEYLRLFTSQLKTQNTLTNVNYDSSEDWDLIRSYNPALDDLTAVNGLFNKCNSDYIINITRIEITNRVQTSTSSGPNNQMHTSSQEYCVVKVRFQLMDKNSRKRVLEFESRGESAVNFFAFEKALDRATENSIIYAVEFLKTGKKEF